jgi:hypothetical protein
VGTSGKAYWRISLGETLLFNRRGLEALRGAVEGYRGSASRLSFRLRPDAATLAHFYSLQPQGEILLPVLAEREDGDGTTKEISLSLAAKTERVAFPRSLRAEDDAPIPPFLLMPYSGDFDLLFANQIAVLNAIEDGVRSSPAAWLRALSSTRRVGFRRKLALGFRSVDPTADVHPTAVIEGSYVGPGAYVGAHCVVRFSHIGAGARLHDGAKAEFSVVGPRSWLMHDLVLYRCYTEEEVFLIHGPYQFSGFQSRSAAFATILMDYRPDGKPIRVRYGEESREYRGPFLGSLLKEGAKTLGGSLIAPGLVIPSETWLGADAEAVHRQPAASAPRQRAFSPPRKPEMTQ